MQAFLNILGRVLGNELVLGHEAAQRIYGACTTGINRKIAGAVRPHSTQQVSQVVHLANEYRISLYPISTGKNWGYGTANPVIDDCIIVDLSNMDRIIEFNPDTGVVTLEPGVTQLQLRAYLDRHGYRFMVPVTGAGPHCSLLGNALERGYGITPHTDHFSAVTHLEAILPNGELYRGALSTMGGKRIDHAFKWGLGPYLDGLFTQSGMGIVIQMSIALARIPERTEAFFFSAASESQLEGVVKGVQDILANLNGITGSINLMNAHRILAMTVPYPIEEVEAGSTLSAALVAEYARRYRITPWTGVGALYGTKKVVCAAHKEVRRFLRPHASRLVFLTQQKSAQLNRFASWLPKQIRLRKRLATLDASLQLIAGHPGEVALPLAYWKSGIQRPAELDPARDRCGLIWYPPLVPMEPKTVRAYVEMVKRICEKHRIEPLITLTSLSDRCFDSSVPLLFKFDDVDGVDRAHACYRELFETGIEAGFIPYRLAVHSMPWVTSRDDVFWRTVNTIKKAVDPNGIIAPGRYSPI